MNYKISIIFATYNGEHTLSRLFDSLLKQKNTNDLKWNVIVVDNNSTDKTSQIIKTYQKSLPIIAKFESKKGKNIALNHAISNPTQLGDLVIICDDDLVFSENFIYAYYEAAKEHNSYNIFGGTIVPLWEQEPEPEMLEAIPIGCAFGITDTQINGKIDPCAIYGGNMAVRKSIFMSGFKFNEAIGPKGKDYIAGGETDLLQRLKVKNHKAYFVSKATLKHIIRPWQFEQKWLNNRAYKSGRGMIHDKIRKNEFDINTSSIFYYPRWALVKCLRFYARVLMIKVFRNENKTKKYKTTWELYVLLGFTKEYRKMKKLKLKHNGTNK